MNPQIFGTSPFAPADFEASSTMCTGWFWDPELSRMHLHPQIQIPNAFREWFLANWEKIPTLDQYEVCLLFQLRKISGKNSETNWWKHWMNSLKDFGICLAILTIGFGMRGAIYSGHIKSVLLLSKNFSGKLHKITKSSNIESIPTYLLSLFSW